MAWLRAREAPKNLGFSSIITATNRCVRVGVHCQFVYEFEKNVNKTLNINKTAVLVMLMATHNGCTSKTAKIIIILPCNDFSRTLQFHCNVRLLLYHAVCLSLVVCLSSTTRLRECIVTKLLKSGSCMFY